MGAADSHKKTTQEIIIGDDGSGTRYELQVNSDGSIDVNVYDESFREEITITIPIGSGVAVEGEIALGAAKGKILRVAVTNTTVAPSVTVWDISINDKTGLGVAGGVNELVDADAETTDFNYVPISPIPFENQDTTQVNKIYVVIDPTTGTGAPDTFDVVVEGVISR